MVEPRQCVHCRLLEFERQYDFARGGAVFRSDGEAQMWRLKRLRTMLAREYSVSEKAMRFSGVNLQATDLAIRVLMNDISRHQAKEEHKWNQRRRSLKAGFPSLSTG